MGSIGRMFNLRGGAHQDTGALRAGLDDLERRLAAGGYPGTPLSNAEQADYAATCQSLGKSIYKNLQQQLRAEYKEARALIPLSDRIRFARLFAAHHYLEKKYGDASHAILHAPPRAISQYYQTVKTLDELLDKIGPHKLKEIAFRHSIRSSHQSRWTGFIMNVRNLSPEINDHLRELYRAQNLLARIKGDRDAPLNLPIDDAVSHITSVNTDFLNYLLQEAGSRNKGKADVLSSITECEALCASHQGPDLQALIQKIDNLYQGVGSTLHQSLFYAVQAQQALCKLHDYQQQDRVSTLSAYFTRLQTTPFDRLDLEDNATKALEDIAHPSILSDLKHLRELRAAEPRLRAIMQSQRMIH